MLSSNTGVLSYIKFGCQISLSYLRPAQPTGSSIFTEAVASMVATLLLAFIMCHTVVDVVAVNMVTLLPLSQYLLISVGFALSSHL